MSRPEIQSPSGFQPMGDVTGSQVYTSNPVRESEEHMSKKKRPPPVAHRSMKHRHIAIIIVLSLVAFANSLPGNFVWDDEVQVVKNWRIRGFENLPSAFSSSFWSFLGTEAESQTNFYRPVQTITYMLGYSIGGLSPFVYHVFNVTYHIAATLFVTWSASN